LNAAKSCKSGGPFLNNKNGYLKIVALLGGNYKKKLNTFACLCTFLPPEV
jgi:hypothetical protein